MQETIIIKIEKESSNNGDVFIFKSIDSTEVLTADEIKEIGENVIVNFSFPSIPNYKMAEKAMREFSTTRGVL